MLDYRYITTQVRKAKSEKGYYSQVCRDLDPFVELLVFTLRLSSLLANLRTSMHLIQHHVLQLLVIHWTKKYIRC